MGVLRDRQARLTMFFTEGLGYSAPQIEDLTEQLRDIRKHAARTEKAEIVRKKIIQRRQKDQ